MGIIRAHYYKGPYAASTGVVILKGGENTHKSSWINNLLPMEFADFIFPSQARLQDNMKELQLEAAHCQIWLKDEIEGFLKSGDDKLKNFLVQSKDLYRGLFEREPIPVPRKCIFFGTTNVDELALSDYGNRRIWVIPVEDCDTAAQQKIDMRKVYRELLWEFEQKSEDDQPFLWQLSPKEMELSNQLNTGMKLETEEDMLLKDTYAFDHAFDVEEFLGAKGAIQKTHEQLKTVSTVTADIYAMTDRKTRNLRALPHALKRACGDWTRTMHKAIVIGQMEIYKGKATARDSQGKIKFSKFVLPPLRSVFENQQLEQEKIE